MGFSVLSHDRDVASKLDYKDFIVQFAARDKECDFHLIHLGLWRVEVNSSHLFECYGRRGWV